VKPAFQSALDRRLAVKAANHKSWTKETLANQRNNLRSTGKKRQVTVEDCPVHGKIANVTLHLPDESNADPFLEAFPFPPHLSVQSRPIRECCGISQEE
jgi:hypothetical protein